MPCSDLGFLTKENRLSPSSLHLYQHAIFLSGCLYLAMRSGMKSAFQRMIQDNQRGITGLETAIIMIAFVIVASVFAYVVISSGLFATEKSKEAIYKGLDSAQGAIVLKGGVVAVSEHYGMGGYVSQMTFTLSNEMGGAPVDFTEPLTHDIDGRCPSDSENKVVISYLDPYQKVDNLFWNVQWLGASNGDNLLDGGEMVQITIGNDIESMLGGNLCDALSGHHLAENTRFTLQIASSGSAVLLFERTMPGFIDRTINLH
jgi:archaeal flagellin FlaB